MRVGILGAGQLGRMLALAAWPLGLQPRFYDPVPGGCAAALGPQTVAAWDDLDAVERFCAACDVVTYEFENVPLATVRHAAAFVPLFPAAQALEAAQDRLAEKALFQGLGIGTAPFAAIDGPADFDSALEAVGLPAILKSRRLGYDGKGQVAIRSGVDLERAWQRLGQVPAILEGVVPFERELSLIAVRGGHGDTVFYPLVENQHRDGLLHLSRPIVDAALQRHAQDYAVRLLDRLDHIGVLTIEWFVHGGELLGNELAPRVHNSGHWTIEGAATSQFENHLRAICGLPLGATATTGHSAMVNLISAVPRREALLALPWVHLHDYGKEPRSGRKVGHVTLCTPDEAHAEVALANVLELLA